VARYLAGADPTKVISAKADVDPRFPRVDLGTTATLAFPTPTGGVGPADGLTATLVAHLRVPPRFGFVPHWPKTSVRVTGTRGTVELSNFVGPWIYHYITIESSEYEGGPMRKRTEKQYGNLGWTTQVSLWFSCHFFHSDISRLCVDIVISWRHSSTRCGAATLSIGMTRKIPSATLNGSKRSTMRLVISYCQSHTRQACGTINCY
jgi:hypothetical protein